MARHGTAGQEGDGTGGPSGGPGVPPDRTILAASRGDFRSLRLPGSARAKVRWRPRMDVAVAVTPGEFWVTGHPGTLRFPVADMVLASYGSSPRGAVRVDFLEGEPLSVRLEDDGTVLEALRQEIWECEKQFLLDRSDLDWALDVSPAQLAEADALLITAMAEPGPSVGRRLSRSEREELLRRSESLRRAARVDALRRRRRRMLGLPPDRHLPPGGRPGA